MEADSEDNAALVSRLEAFLLSESGSARPILKVSTEVLPTGEEIKSWKIWEWAYGKKKENDLPTMARGLFTCGQRIVIRGYNKFFAIDESPMTNWKAITDQTSGPYSLSFKENGCIIFIAAFTPTQLLVSSKHSLGLSGEKDDDRVHARVGSAWLRKHLERANKTEEQLAGYLYKQNLTAVTELCDDSFEEHVLEYTQDRSGLHLHGLNRNISSLETAPFKDVQAFALEWGFIETREVIAQDVNELKLILDQAQSEGHFQGEVLEGFVVRCMQAVPPELREATSNAKRIFFFKFKFVEPYKMYREWREITRDVLQYGKPSCSKKLDKARRATYPHSAVLFEWLKTDILHNSDQYSQYESHNIGILASRNRFLNYLASEQGVANMERVMAYWGKKHHKRIQETLESDKKPRKTIIFPIGVPGCGKTSLFVALKHLLKRCEHVQSDDYGSKEFIAKLKKAQLRDDIDVIIADRNNHLSGHRQALTSLSAANYIVLNFVVDDIPDLSLLRICSDRILSRGSNHQSLRPAPGLDHKAVVWRFLSELDRLSDDERTLTFEHSLDLDVRQSQEEMLRSVIHFIFPILKLSLPSHPEIQQALSLIAGYAPSVRKTSNLRPRPDTRYFGLTVELNWKTLLQSLPAKLQSAIPIELLAKKPHITLVHSGERQDKTSEVIWQLCAAYTASDDSTSLWSMNLREVLFDGRVMAISIGSLMLPKDLSGESEFTANKIICSIPCKRLHITVGTSDSTINGFEAAAMVLGWNSLTTDPERKASGIESYELTGQEVQGRLEGMY